MNNNDNVHHLELGRRLLAASYELSLRHRHGLHPKTLCPAKIDPSWGELGWELLCAIASRPARHLQRPATSINTCPKGVPQGTPQALDSTPLKISFPPVPKGVGSETLASTRTLG